MVFGGESKKAYSKINQSVQSYYEYCFALLLWPSLFQEECRKNGVIPLYRFQSWAWSWMQGLLGPPDRGLESAETNRTQLCSAP